MAEARDANTMVVKRVLEVVPVCASLMLEASTSAANTRLVISRLEAEGCVLLMAEAHDANTRLVIRVLYVGAFVLLMAGARDANTRAAISWL
jgi:hypothetical protein